MWQASVGILALLGFMFAFGGVISATMRYKTKARKAHVNSVGIAKEVQEMRARIEAMEELKKTRAAYAAAVGPMEVESVNQHLTGMEAQLTAGGK